MRARRVGLLTFLRRLVALSIVVLAVMALAAAALANVPVFTVSEDPFTNTSAYHQTEVEPDTFAWGSTIVSVFQTGRFADGGSDDIGWATTTNGGVGWTHGFMPGITSYSTPAGPYARVSDPSVAYDPKHDTWLALSLTVDTKDDVIVNRSTDGGLTWRNPVVVSSPVGSNDYDKTWVACDTWAASPNYGNCYATWDDFVHADTMMLSRSTDGGKHWSVASVATAHGLGGQPVAQPNGHVVVPFWADAGQIQSLVSTDGGTTYTGPYTISTQTDHGVVGLRTEPLPSAEVDNRGRVYTVWQDCRFRSACTSNDIVMSTSKNGKTWSATVRIPIDGVTSGQDHFIPGIGVNTVRPGANVHLGLTYYYYPNASCSLTTCKLNAAFVSSTDGGATWSSPTKILGPLRLAWLPNAGGRFVGDYISTSIFSDRGYMVIANATAGTCTLGQITSCHEFMGAPATGLPITGGPLVARAGPVRSTHSDHPAGLPRRVF
jgi:BNR repeat-like domain